MIPTTTPILCRSCGEPVTAPAVYANGEVMRSLCAGCKALADEVLAVQFRSQAILLGRMLGALCGAVPTPRGTARLAADLGRGRTPTHCGEPMQYIEPTRADPDCNIGAAPACWECECGHTEEIPGRDEEGA